MKIFVLAIALSFPTLLHSQEVLVSDSVPASPPSSKKFHPSLSLGIGLITGASGGAGTPIKYINSNTFDIGLGFKYRFTGLLSAGMEVFYQEDKFRIKQEAGKTLPDTILHRKEILKVQQPGAQVYIRLNFDPKRGNIPGKYIDLAFRGTYISGGRHIFFDRNEPPVSGASRTKVINSGLNYLESISYGPEVRFGSDKAMFFGRYRLTDLIKGFDDVPAFAFGVRFVS